MREKKLKSSSDRTQDVRRVRVNEHVDALYSEYTLSDIRRRVGLTQCQMAEKLNVSQPAYASFEKGGNLRVGTLQKIASALGVNLSIEMTIKGQHLPLSLKFRG